MPGPRRASNGGGGGSAEPGAGEGQEIADTNIKVAVRCRPMSTNERMRGEQSCFRIENGTACLENPANPGDVHRYLQYDVGVFAVIHTRTSSKYQYCEYTYDVGLHSTRTYCT